MRSVCGSLSFALDHFYMATDDMFYSKKRLTNDLKGNMKLGVNTKFGLGRPRAIQIGLEHDAGMV